MYFISRRAQAIKKAQQLHSTSTEYLHKANKNKRRAAQYFAEAERLEDASRKVRVSLLRERAARACMYAQKYYEMAMGKLIEAQQAMDDVESVAHGVKV